MGLFDAINSIVKPRPETKDELISLITTYMVTGDSLNNIDVSAITDMSHLFEGSGWNGDISSWDVSHVTNMERMFRNSKFNGDISKWDVSNVENMEGMFSSSEFNGDVSKWNVSKVTNMRSLFYGTKFTGDISNWDVSNVTNMRTVFYKSKFNGNISNWNVSKVQTMESMFMYSEFNGDISGWDVSNVENMKDIFKGSKFKGNIFNWHVDKIQDVSSLWDGDWSPEDSKKLEQKFSSGKTKEPQKGMSLEDLFKELNGASCFFTGKPQAKSEPPKFISGVFTDKESLKAAIKHNISTFGPNVDLNSIDVSQITDMSNLFAASAFNGDISKWDVSHVTNMERMFHSADFKGDISGWNVSNVTNMKGMFGNASFNGDISKWDVSHVVDMSFMFFMSRFHGDLSAWKISTNCNTQDMFDHSKFSKEEQAKILPSKSGHTSVSGNYFVDPRDGQKYRTVKIGNQIWMAENLRYRCKSGCYAYDDDEDYVKIMGRLYEWDVVEGACPPGWHLPEDREWSEFRDCVGLNADGEDERVNNFRKIIVKPWAENLDIIPHLDEKLPPSRYRDLEEKRVNQQLKEINALKFSLVPSGRRDYNALSGKPSYSDLGLDAYFWNATLLLHARSGMEDERRREFFDFGLNKRWDGEKIWIDCGDVPELDPYPCAFSIRCIKD